LDIDLEELAAVVRLLREAEFSEFCYTKGDVSLVVRRGELSGDRLSHQLASAESRPLQSTTATESRPVQPPIVPSPAPVAPTSPPEPTCAQGPLSIVNSPLLGTFYRSPKPGEPPFVNVGDHVDAGTILCIVEVMKLMNSVEAGVAGVLSAIHAADGELVEHGQPLFTIKPAEQRT